MAEQYGPFAAFCFDNAVTTFGRALEAELDSVKPAKTEKATEAKRARLLDKWLDRPLRYRNPSVGPTADASVDAIEEQYTVAGDGSA